jgi:hypothetical protein
MSNVIQFQPKAKEQQPEAPAAEVVAEMVKQSAAMQVISTLAFYANQGFDHGDKARSTMSALQELLKGAGFEMKQQPAQ